MGLRWWLRGLRLLRHEDVVRELGERHRRRQLIREIRESAAGCRIASDVRFIPETDAHLQLGEGVTIESGTLLVFGDTTNGFSTIHVGDHTWIGQYNNLRSGPAEISIGRYCLISQFCTLVATNHSVVRGRRIALQPPDPCTRGIVLEDDVWLGAGVVVTAGVRIGEGAVIGANAVVTRDVPPYEIWAGVPARRIGERREETSPGLHPD